MKKLALALLLIPFFCQAQNEMGNDSIPVVNGKVVFSSEYHPKLNKNEIRIRLENWLTNSFLDKKEVINSNDPITGIIVCKKTDVLVLVEKPLVGFNMNMRYTFTLEYKDNYCLASIRQISYTDPDEKLSPIKETQTVYPAETILVDKAFKNIFIRGASDKIATQTLDRVEQIFKDIHMEFTSKVQKDASKTRRNVSTKAAEATPDN